MIARWIDGFMRRIPRRAWQVYLNGYAGYIAFGLDYIFEELEYSEDDDIWQIRDVWISPAKLETYPEFQGW